MEVLTTEQRLGIIAETPALPVGQMCRKLQYPFVTVKDLENRFAVHKLAEAYNQKEKERILVDLAKLNLIPLEEVAKRVSINLESSTYRDREASSWEDDMMRHMMMYEALSGRRGAQIQEKKSKPVIKGAIKAKYCAGRVVIEALDAYMGDEIPPRVLESLYVAREAGLKDFHVAYPVIDVKEVEVRQEQQKDPVLLAKLGDKYLEIDMWE